MYVQETLKIEQMSLITLKSIGAEFTNLSKTIM